jgi:hypothetical protein
MADWKTVNAGRVRGGPYGSDDSFGFTGYFRFILEGQLVKVIASDMGGWQHVSVSLESRPNVPPKWSIMCHIKDLFWEDEDVVIQIHPRKSEYVNYHPGCLHLWRCTDGREQPTPPSIFVGPKPKAASPSDSPDSPQSAR